MAGTINSIILKSYSLILIIALTMLNRANSTKCSYSFIVNEVNPDNCPCLMEAPSDSRTNEAQRTWLPPPSQPPPGQLNDDKSNFLHYPTGEEYRTNQNLNADTTQLQSQVEQLQQQHQDMYQKLKELEIKMYKESMHNLELKNALDRQEQTLKDYRYITERLKQEQDDYEWELEQHKLHLKAEYDQMRSSVDEVKDTIDKHEHYLNGLDSTLSDTASDELYNHGYVPTRVDRMLERRGVAANIKYIPVRAATSMRCDGLSHNVTKYKDCDELYERGHRSSGVYYITPDYTPCPIPVYCEMHTEGDEVGGWLVIQRRKDGIQNFNRNWTDYRNGFGDLNGEFWLGNDNIFLLSNQASYKLRIDIWDFNDTKKYAQYEYFKIGGERDKYRLLILNFTGNVRDGFSHHNGQLFSTPDEDNDSWTEHHCAREWKGGWWFDKCWFVILNGWYFNTPHVKYRGIAWNHWKPEQLKRAEMKIKPSDYM